MVEDDRAVGQTESPALEDAQKRQMPSPPDSDTEDEESDELSSDEDYFSAEDDESSQDPRARVLSVLELEDLLLREAPPLSGWHYIPFAPPLSDKIIDFCDASGQVPAKLNVGLVGYPNVGKSSTINSLLGEKKVSVSSTPGKTKHFQTIHLSESIILCDCPGLVFPQFATTKADLICDGVLPIDQMREYTAPVALVVKRIPKEVLEAIYGLSIKTQGVDEGGDGKIAGQDLLITYASRPLNSTQPSFFSNPLISCTRIYALESRQPR
jgi:large subunit GTPase 1